MYRAPVPYLAPYPTPSPSLTFALALLRPSSPFHALPRPSTPILWQVPMLTAGLVELNIDRPKRLLASLSVGLQPRIYFEGETMIEEVRSVPFRPVALAPQIQNRIFFCL